MAEIPDYIAKLAENWTHPYVARSQISEFTNGLYSASYLYKKDSQGKGPARRVTFGRRGRGRTGGQVVYPMPELLAWLASMIVDDTGLTNDVSKPKDGATQRLPEGFR